MRVGKQSKAFQLKRAPSYLPPAIEKPDIRRIDRVIEAKKKTAFVGLSHADIEKLSVRLSNAAAKFWPTLGRDERHDRVNDTVCTAIERAQYCEFHTISWWAKHMFRRSHDKALKIRETGVDDVALEILGGTIPPGQYEYALACELSRILKYLPERHRKIVMLRADGANPIEISEELKIEVTTVLRLLDEARRWLADGGCYLGRESDRGQ